MTKIQKLSQDLVNKIAAGEVIERPASAIKELVENSLDAGSTDIVIKIQDGGKKLIQVIDDGCGIAPKELALAIERHATSKIEEFEDLYHLQTKGFRGEALASLAAVSQMTLASKTKDHEASEILVESSQVIDQRACAQAQGTRIEVKYLFYKTPARLKFLKTAATEAAHVTTTVTKLALSHPHVGFSLYHDQKKLLVVPKNQDLKSRMVALLGKDLEPYLFEFSSEAPGKKVAGYFSHPQVARSQKTQTFFFVNGRAVSDKVLWHATLEAYRDLLMKGKYPVVVLDLQVDENTVDVNVHPTKAEVRFHRSQDVHSFVYRALRDRLKQAPWLNQTTVDTMADGESNFEPSSENQLQSVKQSVKTWSQNYFQQPATSKAPSYTQSQTIPAPLNEPAQRKIQFGKTSYAEMNPIGQLLGTYILCEHNDRLILIDQHAAHERVGFEQLMIDYKENGLKSQRLLIPQTFDLKPSDAEILKNYLHQFLQFGFEMEFFGGNTFVLKAVPVLLEGKVQIETWLTNLIEDLKASGELTSLKDKLHHVLATMACHAQIRAHHHLTLDEMKALLKELDHYQFTDFCPHGRPVSVEVTLFEIEKWFKRIL